MIDLETWGTSHEAVIISIGAVKFDPNKKGPADYFHVAIAPASCMSLGLKVDAKTVEWWMNPDRTEALCEWWEMEKIDLPSALDGFKLWYGGESLPTWGNGASFDLVIMESAFRACYLECPWKFTDQRCFRTLKSLTTIKRKKTAHNALTDAKDQVEWLQAIVKKLKLKL